MTGNTPINLQNRRERRAAARQTPAKLTNTAQSRLFAAALRNLIAKKFPKINATAIISGCVHVGVFGALNSDFAPQLPNYLRDIADQVEKHLQQKDQTDERPANQGMPGPDPGDEATRSTEQRVPKNGDNGPGPGDVEG